MKRVFILITLVVAFAACKNTTKKVRSEADEDAYRIAYSFLDKNADSAFYYFSKMATTVKDSLYAAGAYSYLAQVQYNAGDYFGSQESGTRALALLHEDNPDDLYTLSSTVNELALSNLYLKRYDIAIEYSNLAIKYNKDKSLNGWLQNNKALAYQGMERYDEAIKIYTSIIPQLKNNPEQYARAISNLARTRWLEDKNYNPIPEFLKALNLREIEKDFRGMNASYAHIADYYAQIKPDSVLKYSSKMYEVAKKINNPDDKIEALQKLIGASTPGKAKLYFSTYLKLNDSLQDARNAAKNQFALVRYETEKHKTDNLRLQKDATEKKYQLVALAVITFAAVIIAFIWYRKRKQRLQLEAQTAIRESQLRTSKKVHDVVANGLYRVMSEIENRDEMDKEKILDKIEDLYEKSRDISYEHNPAIVQQYHSRLQDLLLCFATDQVDIVIKGNNESVWDSVSERARTEVEHILQELMVNMDKHSQATHVEIKFERQPQQVSISYADNGIGIGPPKFKNGLTNTENRIESISGSITFETNGGGGLSIQIAFPVS